MKKRRILFLGETYRADAITWMNGLKEFGDFEIVTWELRTPSIGFWKRSARLMEYLMALLHIRNMVRAYRPDMVIAERTTSYGFLAALSGVKPTAIAQQGIDDLWPKSSVLFSVKKTIQRYAFKKASLIHAWGKVIANTMQNENVDMQKVLVLPKGVNLDLFAVSGYPRDGLKAIVTRSLSAEYRHDIILRAFGLIHQKGVEFSLAIVGDGPQMHFLKELSKKLKIDDKVEFLGRVRNTLMPALLEKANFYISMPITEGVSSSLFEAMATQCYPLVTDIPGNRNFINHRENGQLVAVDDYKMLAEELVWALNNPAIRSDAIEKNRKFVEDNADYKTNMKIISKKYHELIDTNQKSQHVRD